MENVNPKKRLKCIRKRTVEDVIEVEDDEFQVLHIENLNINDEEYKLDICSREGVVVLNFNDGGYHMNINDGRITFNRTLYRPNHDHDDKETLYISVDEKKSGKEPGTLEWRKGNYNEGWKPLKVEFGSKTIDL